MMRVFSPVSKAPLRKQLLNTRLIPGAQQVGVVSEKQTLAETARTHPWTYATVDAVVRSAIGAGWKIVPTEENPDGKRPRDRDRLSGFYNYVSPTWNNIKDFSTLADKIAYTIAMYQVVGSCGWEIIYDQGRPVGFDPMYGIVVPNVDDRGKFLEGAFRFYPWGDTHNYDVFPSNKVVYFWNPGITGALAGESPYSSLASTTIPSDLFAAISYRSLFENVNAPYNGYWSVDPGVSDDDLDLFISLLNERYSGYVNYGRNPLVIRGAAEFHPVSARSEEDAPYLEGRSYNRSEIIAATGVDGNKLGITYDANKSNIRETRREFHENVMRPLFIKLESALLAQVNQRALGINSWALRFNRADMTTAIEQASIDMRLMQWGVFSPNEVRAQRGEEPRDGGDIYYVPLNMTTGENNSGVNQQDRPTESPTDGQPPQRAPRDDENPDSAKVIKELKAWRKLTLESMDGKREPKVFEREFIPEALYDAINESLSCGESDNFEYVKSVFAASIELVEEENGREKAAEALELSGLQG